MAEPERWVICPVCDKPNPAGTRFCEHCWGAAINQEHPLTSQELAEFNERLSKRARLRRRLKFGAAGVLGLALIGIILYSLFYFSDSVFKPPVTMSSNPPADEWTMFHRDLSHSGSYGEAVPQGNLKWTFSTGAEIYSSPAVVDDLVYFGSRDYHFYALDAQTGSLAWNYRTGSWVESSPAVTGGLAYVGSNDGYFYAFDAKTGEKAWDFKTAFPVRSSPAIADDRVYIGSDDYYLYSLNKDTGKLTWKYDTGSPAFSSPAVSDGIIFIGSANGYSYALNSLNGQRRLRFKSHYAVYAGPVVDEETVVFTTTNGIIWAVDGKARTRWREHEIKHWWLQIWAAGVPGIPKPPDQSGLLWTQSLGRAHTSTPVIADGVMYLGSDNALIAIDIETRETLWQFATGGTVRSSPALTGSTLFVGSEDGYIYAVDAESGEEIWSYKTGGKVVSSPAVVNGVLYVGSFDGKLYAFD